MPYPKPSPKGGALTGVRIIMSADGKVDGETFVVEVTAHANREGWPFETKRYFCDRDDLISANGKTYAFTNQWGARTAEPIAILLKAFPDKGVSFKASDSI